MIARHPPPAVDPPAPARTYRVFGFPDPVNELSARLVAGGVVMMVAAAIAFDWRWLTGVIAYGFVARVLTGPRRARSACW